MDRWDVGNVEDLTTLAKLDESILLEELKARYKNNKIYTYVGDILIAVNPFKPLDIYGDQAVKKYALSKKSENPPHIFAVADMAYQSMLGYGGISPRNQCILISGESGAGKTESTKLIIKQLINLCEGNAQLERQILQVNPLLEAFGNAQTLMNDNSSRFGKFIQLKFKGKTVMGAKISEYLLEKSRVVRQNSGEENFHIFYYLFGGLADSNQYDFQLGSAENYRYLSHTGNMKSKFKQLQAGYEDLMNSMDLVGFTDEEQENMFTVIASVLHLGNTDFTADESDASHVAEPNGAVKRAANLLKIDAKEVGSCLTSMVTVTRGEHVTRNYTKQQAEDARDAMSKALYGRLFGWIVNKVNILLAPQDTISPAEQKEIGILDIFGFEHFEKNSFEQACINLANEQLQFFFNHHIFKQEQEEYIREGVDWKEIKFVDNQPLLDLFLAKPIGILALVDEESNFPKGTDQSLVEKLSVHFGGKSHHFIKSQQTNSINFAINHYAGKVTYDATNWLEKNRDRLPPGIMEILQSSNNALVKSIFRGQITRTGSLALQGRKSTARRSKQRPQSSVGGTKRIVTVGSQFKSSLNILMERMMSSTPIFIRCLKPNHQKKAGVFDEKYILAQLLYTGMLETTKIRREGFAVRPSFDEFIEKYKILLCRVDLPVNGNNCKQIIEVSHIKGCFVGKTKVFLKYYHVEQLQDVMKKMGKSAVHLQKVARGFLARCRVKVIRVDARKRAAELASLMLYVEEQNMKNSRNQQSLISNDKQRTASQLVKLKQQNLPPAVPPYPGSIASSRYEEPKVSFASCGIQADSSDEEILEDDFSAPGKRNKYGKMGTKMASIRWFQETQTDKVIESDSGTFAEWFHGIITRAEAEKLLQGKPVGCYLIRVSESRFGYSLSFKAEERARHYMIDQTPNGKYIIVGEPKVHRTLKDLVSYHQTHQLSNWAHFLKEPCGQVREQCDYEELLDERTYFVLENKKTGKKSRVFQKKSDAGPEIPERNYSRHIDTTNRLSEVQESQKNRPLPKVPEESYHRLLQNQTAQHSYDLPGDSSQRKKVSTSRQHHK